MWRTKGFIDNKTNIWVWIDIFCVSAYWEYIIFWSCGCSAVEILVLCCADLKFLSFADLAVQIQASSAHWSLSWSVPSVLILNLKVRKRWGYNAPFGAHLTYFCTVLLWFVILPSVDPSGSATDTSCVWGEPSVCGAASAFFSITFSTSGSRKVLESINKSGPRTSKISKIFCSPWNTNKIQHIC